MKNSYHKYFFYQKYPMGTVTYKVAGLFCVSCLFVCFPREKNNTEKHTFTYFFASSKKNQKHSIRFWYFFRSIFFYFKLLLSYWNVLLWSQWNTEKLFTSQILYRSQKHFSDFKSESSPIHISENRLFYVTQKTCDPEIEIK